MAPLLYIGFGAAVVIAIGWVAQELLREGIRFAIAQLKERWAKRRP